MTTGIPKTERWRLGMGEAGKKMAGTPRSQGRGSCRSITRERHFVEGRSEITVPLADDGADAMFGEAARIFGIALVAADRHTRRE